MRNKAILGFLGSVALISGLCSCKDNEHKEVTAVIRYEDFTCKYDEILQLYDIYISCLDKHLFIDSDDAIIRYTCQYDTTNVELIQYTDNSIELLFLIPLNN